MQIPWGHQLYLLPRHCLGWCFYNGGKCMGWVCPNISLNNILHHSVTILYFVYPNNNGLFKWIMHHVIRPKLSRTGLSNLEISDEFCGNMNPIQCLWDVVERPIWMQDPAPININELNICPEIFQPLVEPMLYRVPVYHCARETPTQY